MTRSEYTRILVAMLAIIFLVMAWMPVSDFGEATTFSYNNFVIEDNKGQTEPQVAASGSGNSAKVYVVYEDLSFSPDTHVIFERSDDGGETFDHKVDFIEGGESGDTTRSPAMDNNGDEIVIVYLDSQWRTGPTNKYLLRAAYTDNGGDSWSFSNITPYGGDYPNNKISYPEVCIDPEGNFFAVWIESSKTYISFSDDYGNTWSPIQKVKEHNDPDLPSYSQFQATVASTGEDVVVTWYANPDYKEWVFTTYANIEPLTSPLSFSDPDMIPEYTYPHPQAFYPKIVANDTNFHVAWWDFSTEESGANHELKSDRPCIKYSKSTNGGETFRVQGQTDIIVNTSEPEGWHSAPDIAVTENGNLAIVWYDNTQGNNNPNVFVSTSVDGTAWSKPARVTNYKPGLEREDPQIAFDDAGNIHVIWLSREPGKDWDIAHSKSIVNQPPLAVQNIQNIGVTEYSGTITWDINREPDFKHYSIHISNQSGFTPNSLNRYNTTTKQNKNTFEFTELDFDTTYYAKVVVEDMDGLETPSVEISFKTDVINLKPRFMKDFPDIYMQEDGKLENAFNLTKWIEEGWVWDDDYKGQTSSLGLQFEIISLEEESNIRTQVKKIYNNTVWTVNFFTDKVNWYGQEQFRIRVKDAGKDMGFNTPDDLTNLSNTFTVFVNATNDRPDWAQFEDLSSNYKIAIKNRENLTIEEGKIGCREDNEYTFALSCTDIDGDFIEYTCEDPRVDISPDTTDPQRKSTFKITPTNDDVPTLKLNITADDTNGGTREIMLVLPVQNLNDLPRFTHVNNDTIQGTGYEATYTNFSVNETESITFTVHAKDIDMNDVMTLTTESERPSIEKISDGAWEITVDTTKDDASKGSVQFTLELLDRDRSYPSTLNIYIEVKNIQDQPQWERSEKTNWWPIYDQDDPNEWEEQTEENARPEWGEDVKFSAYAEDLDGDILNYTWTFTGEDGSSKYIRYGKTVNFEFMPSDGNLSRKQNERFTVNVTISDGHTTPLYFQWNVVVWSDADNDNDGLPDNRELYFFNRILTADEDDLAYEYKSLLTDGVMNDPLSLFTPDGDPDGDGYPNKVEMGFEIARDQREIDTGEPDPNLMTPLGDPPEIEPPQNGGEEKLNIPTWIIVTVSIVVAILIAFVVAILVIIRYSKIKEKKEEEEIDKKVEEMDKRQKEISGLYGDRSSVGEDFGPDQSTLDDLKIDMGGETYHTESGEVKSGKLKRDEEEKKETGPAWESTGTEGPLFDSDTPGLEFGESLEVGQLDPEDLKQEDDYDIDGTMDELVGAADSFNEDEVKEAGGKVQVGAVPMKDQIGEGPRNPPPGQQPPQQQEGMPQGQHPPDEE